MKLACVSDTHGKTPALPAADVAVHVGDACVVGTMLELQRFVEWFSEAPAEVKIYVPGNHDWPVQREEDRCRALLDEAGVHLLVDESLVVNGFEFWGSPWTPTFCDWAFMLDRGSVELGARWAMIPDEVDVLLTHGPPWGVLDRVGSRQVGCELLGEELERLDHLQLHVFGHVHEGAGVLARRQGPTFVNAAHCDGTYRGENPPVLVQLEDWS